MKFWQVGWLSSFGFFHSLYPLHQCLDGKIPSGIQGWRITSAWFRRILAIKFSLQLRVFMFHCWQFCSSTGEYFSWLGKGFGGDNRYIDKTFVLFIFLFFPCFVWFIFIPECPPLFQMPIIQLPPLPTLQYIARMLLLLPYELFF